ncbi:hypothetical protein DITRI_Ditri02bG0061400 [Diplodiscus trichospermus]
MGTILNRFIMVSAIDRILVLQFSPGICYAKKVSAVFVFGDSLFEAGNNFYINTVAKPTYPNGIDFVNGSPSGRYTNARTVLDIKKNWVLEITLLLTWPPPPKTTGDVILKGVNYASSASGIFNSTGSKFGAHICMDAQTGNFPKTRQEIISRTGTAAARKLLRRALYYIAIGANDILSEPASSSLDEDFNYLDNMISRFKSQLITLYNLDARKIAVTNMAPLGCIPNQKDKYSTDDCVADVIELAKLYNIKLKKLLQQLTTILAGFENADSACCHLSGKHGGKIPCVPFSRVCRDRSKYVFWDAYHPTENANLIAAKRVLDGDIRYVSPINIRQTAC